LAVEADLGQTTLNVGFIAEKGAYSADENDNYTDTTINAGAGFEITSRHKLDLNATLKAAHDARGADTATAQGSAALAVDPDEYDESVWDAEFTYGSASALLNMTFGLNRYEKEYTNNRGSAGVNTENRDHVKTAMSVSTAINVSDRSDFVVDLSNTDIDYNEDNSITEARDGSLLKALVGMTYDISGKLTSTVKVGVAQRSFTKDGIDSDSSLSWNANLQWTPRTYSTITLYTAQMSNETSGPGNYIDSSYSMVSWKHDFSEFFSLKAEASLASDAYYKDVSDREDDTVSYGLTGTYSPTKSLDVFANVKQAERDSSDAGLDYEQQVITLGVVLAI